MKTRTAILTAMISLLVISFFKPNKYDLLVEALLFCVLCICKSIEKIKNI